MRLPRLVRTIAILGLLAAGGGAGVLYLDRHPLTSSELAADPEVAGVVPPTVAHADVALVIDSRAIANSAAAGSFRALDLSCALLSPLEAEFGPVTLLDAAAPRALEGGLPRALVVSSSAQGDEDVVALAARVLASGGTVLVEPAGNALELAESWLDLAGLERDDPGLAPFPAGDWLPQGTLSAERAAAFAAAPWPRPVSYARLRPRGAATRAPADPTLVFENHVRAPGEGKLIVVAVRLSRLFATMLQGSPTADDFSLTERHGDYPDIVEPDDLVADPRLRENETPFADLLARAVARLLDPPRGPPLPRLLWFPPRSRGVYLMTHDEDLRGGAAMLDLAERDAAMGVPATHFVIGHPRIQSSARDWPEGGGHAGELLARGHALALHWNQMPTPRGVGPIEPLQWVAPLADQIDWFARIDPRQGEGSGLSPAINRNHFLILAPSWSRSFRQMAAAGIRLDSTLGANKGRGYLFGTARPYRLLDENGLPLAVRELPFQNQENWGGVDAAFFTRLFGSNADDAGGAIVSIFHPASVLREPTDPALIAHAAATALATSHHAATFPEYLDFWGARVGAGAAAAPLRSVVAGENRLRIECDLPRELAVGFPLRAGETAIATDSGGAALPIEARTLGGGAFGVMVLPRGSSVVLVEFRGD
jgi:hypothetical protein